MGSSTARLLCRTHVQQVADKRELPPGYQLIDSVYDSVCTSADAPQTNVSFHQAYDPAGPSMALPLTDATNYILANFGSVAEARNA